MYLVAKTSPVEERCPAQEMKDKSIGAEEWIETLVQHGIPIDVVNERGQSYLHRAVASQDVSLVKVLLAHGARSNLPDKQGTTPLDLAMKMGQAGESLRALLVEAGKSSVPFKPTKREEKDKEFLSTLFKCLLKQPAQSRTYICLAVPSEPTQPALLLIVTMTTTSGLHCQLYTLNQQVVFDYSACEILVEKLPNLQNYQLIIKPTTLAHIDAVQQYLDEQQGRPLPEECIRSDQSIDWETWHDTALAQVTQASPATF